VVIGGFPCQDFSHAGKRLGLESTRGNLYKNMAAVIAQLQPKVFLAENVKGLLTMDNGSAMGIIMDDFAPTMRAEHHGNIEFHYDNMRRLSAREASRIQSFPDDFIFYPSTSSAYRQIGNAVPPVFAWHIARAVQDFLDAHLGYVWDSAG
jgi:site-specific DNA-cytosine methylase